MDLPRGKEPQQVLSPAVRLVLIYGEDYGLIRERATACAVAIAGDARDPFRVVEIDGARLKDDPARLGDECQQISFGGGGRVVWIKDAGDRAGGEIITRFLEAPVGGALVIVEAGELPKTSSLRKAAEAAPHALACPCYHDDPARLARVIDSVLRGHGQTLAPDAEAWLIARMGADRATSRAELEKLCLYVGDKRRIELADVEAAVADSAEATIDAVVQATADGDVVTLETALDRCFLDGEASVGIIRVTLRHFQRLHLAAGAVAQGVPTAAAIRGLRPPPFPRQAERLTRQLQRWPLPRLTAALIALQEAEAQCKQTVLPDRTICARALTALAEAARRQR